MFGTFIGQTFFRNFCFSGNFWGLCIGKTQRGKDNELGNREPSGWFFGFGTGLSDEISGTEGSAAGIFVHLPYESLGLFDFA